MQPVNAVRRFWTEPVRAEPLAAFRVVAALVITWSVTRTIAWDATLYFSDQGLIPGAAADEILSSTGRFSLKRGPGGAWGAALDGPTGTYVLLALLYGLLALLALGRWPRAAAAGAYLLLAAFTQRSISLTNGGDDLAVQALFYLALAPAGAMWALGGARGTPTQVEAQAGSTLVWVPPWALRLMQLQLCLVYFFTGLSKLTGPGPQDWLTGEAVYWALNDITLTSTSYAQLPMPVWACKILSYATLAFELGFPFLIWVRRLRIPLLLVGVGLHAGIALSMQVGAFSQHMLMFYVLFLPPETLARWADRARALLRRRAGVRPEPTPNPEFVVCSRPRRREFST